MSPFKKFWPDHIFGKGEPRHFKFGKWIDVEEY